MFVCVCIYIYIYIYCVYVCVCVLERIVQSNRRRGNFKAIKKLILRTQFLY